MGTDDLFKKRRGEKKRRSENIRRIAPYRYLIVCEGEETEPNYFRGIKERIEKVYKDKIDVKSKIELDIKGTGRNTEDLVDFAIMLRSLSAIPYGHVWVVFDKDDFSDEQFNNSIAKAKQNGIKVAWSNESIELWFLIHFINLDAAIHRTDYIKKLNQIFTREGINGGRYEKNLKDIFEILSSSERLYRAIERSKKLRETFDCKDIQPSKMNPCTTVDILVEELIEYITRTE